MKFVDQVFFIKEDCILTNYHVIEKLKSIYVELIDGVSFPAKIIFKDEYYDISVLRINYKKIIY